MNLINLQNPEELSKNTKFVQRFKHYKFATSQKTFFPSKGSSHL